MSYKTKQDAWIKKHNIKVGDQVTILASYPSYHKGWTACWDSDMDCAVGKDWYVVGFCLHGLRLCAKRMFEESYMDVWSFPYNVLEPVKNPKEVKKEKVKPKSESEEVTYTKKQKEWVRKHNIREGSKVKVIRKALSGEDGWDNSWTTPMSDFIGEECFVVFIGNDIELNRGRGCDAFGFPYFVLEPEMKVETVTVGQDLFDTLRNDIMFRAEYVKLLTEKIVNEYELFREKTKKRQPSFKDMQGVAVKAANEFINTLIKV